jgi:hypothetical protein
MWGENNKKGESKWEKVLTEKGGRRKRRVKQKEKLLHSGN